MGGSGVVQGFHKLSSKKVPSMSSRLYRSYTKVLYTLPGNLDVSHPLLGVGGRDPYIDKAGADASLCLCMLVICTDGLNLGPIIYTVELTNLPL